MVTELQERAAQAIVNIFETGQPLGDYGRVTVVPGDLGHLTYGRSQTTLASGNLHLLIKAYCEAPGATHAAALAPFLERLARRDFALDAHIAFRRLLAEAGDDPVMHEVQDQFFNRVYWTPAEQIATAIGITTALGCAVVYDSKVHGSWDRMRDRTTSGHGTPAAIGERQWVPAYVTERRNWLATHANALLRRTVYRMDAFQRLIDAGNWDLALPFRVRGVPIDEGVLEASAPVRISAEDNQDHTLLLRTPRMRGENVRALQRALAAAGFAATADGIFGPKTDQVVRAFQRQRGLTVDGIVGPATRAALGL